MEFALATQPLLSTANGIQDRISYIWTSYQCLWITVSHAFLVGGRGDPFWRFYGCLLTSPDSVVTVS